MERLMTLIPTCKRDIRIQSTKCMSTNELTVGLKSCSYITFLTIVLIFFSLTSKTLCSDGFVFEKSNIISQISDSGKIELPKSKIKEKKRFQLPVQFGFHYGYGIGDDHAGDKNFTSYEGFIDINLTRHLLYLSVDYNYIEGRNYDYNRFRNFSLGVKYRWLRAGYNNAFVKVALVPNNYTIPYIKISASYMYAIMNLVGITFNSSYFFHFTINNYYWNFMIGIQVPSN